MKIYKNNVNKYIKLKNKIGLSLFYFLNLAFFNYYLFFILSRRQSVVPYQNLTNNPLGNQE